MIQDNLIAEVLSWKYGKRHGAEKPFTLTIDDEERKRIIRISGRIDDRIESEDGTVVMPIEGKTQGGWLSKKTEPSYHHVAQLYPYLVETGAEYGFLVYIDSTMAPKYDADTISKTFIVDFNYDKWKELTNIIIYLDRCLTDNILPAAEASFSDLDKWKCRYCAYAKQCDLLGEEEFSFDGRHKMINILKDVNSFKK